MRERSVTYADVEHVLRRGQVAFIETLGEERWHVEGKDVDGRSIRVVTVLKEEVLVIKVITVVTPKG